MRNIRKRSAVYNRRRVFKRLYEVGFHRVFQKHRHRTYRAGNILCAHVVAVRVQADDDVPKPFFQIVNIRRKTKHRHNFARRRDIEMILAFHASAFSADCNIDKLTLVHIHTAVEINIIRVNFQLVTAENMIIHKRAKQVVRRRNRVQVAREMQINFRHRHDLCISAACRAALYPKHRTKRRFAQSKTGLFTDFGKSVRKTDRNGGFALARRGGVNRRYQNEFGCSFRVFRQSDFCLVFAVQFKVGFF